MFCSLIKFCKKIEAWYFSTLPQEPMIICRIGFGLILFFAFAWRIDGFNFLFSPDGILGGKFYSTYPNTAPVVSQELLPFFVLREITNYSLILFLYILLLITSLTFAIGFYTRTSGIFLFILHSIFAARMEFSFWGWIYMIRPYILYVIFSKAGNYFSIDSLLKKGKLDPQKGSQYPRMGPGWPIRLLQLHVATMYATAGITRLEKPGWLQGKMLFAALNSNIFSRFPNFDWYPYQFYLSVGNYFCLILEASAPFLLWTPQIGRWIALALISMHLTLEIFSTVGWWNPMMICALTTFLPVRWFFNKKNSARLSPASN